MARETELEGGRDTMTQHITQEKLIYRSTHLWWAERDSRGVDANIRAILPFLFKTVDSLYLVTRTFPDVLLKEKTGKSVIGGRNTILIGLSVPADIYANIRCALSLVGDVYCLADQLTKGTLLELAKPIEQLRNEALRFRDARNFFTHLDERLGNLSKHGVSGKAATKCEVYYEASAHNCFHLILSGNVLHFTNRKRPVEAEIGKSAYAPVFATARLLYAEVISHKVHAMEYPLPQELYLKNSTSRTTYQPQPRRTGDYPC